MATRALRTAASGLYAQQINIEVISNNIANVNTTGFKKNKAEFQDLMYQEVALNPSNEQNINRKNTIQSIQVGNGVQAVSSQKIFKQGDITETRNQMDLAIEGEGFFQVRKGDGSFAYTRDGSFKISSDGSFVTASGYQLEPGIALDDSVISVNISRDGTVEAVQTGGGSYVIGNIELVRFMNPGGLMALGDNLYAETEASGVPAPGMPGSEGFGEVHQGFLESSNVDIVEEMISMITAQRAYEINSKTVQTVEEMMTLTNNLKK